MPEKIIVLRQKKTQIFIFFLGGGRRGEERRGEERSEVKGREGFFFQLSSEGFEIRKINDGLTAPIILLFLLNTLHALEIVGRKNARIFRHKFFSFNFLFPPPPPTPHPSPLISNFLFSLQINDLSDDFHFFTNVSFFISITKRKKKKFSRKERISVLKNPRIRGT